MAERKLIIVKAGRRVTSEIEHDAERQCYWIVSSCGGHTQRNSFTPLPNPAYTADQLNYDLEIARHAHAEEAAGKAHLAEILPGSLGQTNGVPVVESGPRHKKPF